MRKKILVTALLCGAIAAPIAAWQVPGSSGLVLEIMARRYGPDGRAMVTAGDHSAGSFEGFAYATSGFCGLGAGVSAPSTAPLAGWRYSGRVLGTTQGATGNQLAVRIEWERMWDTGGEPRGAKGTHSLNMSPGNSVVLDRITPRATGDCQVSEIRLEAAVVARSAPGSFRGTSVGTVAAGGVGGRGAGRGSTATGVPGGVAGVATTEVTSAGGRGAGRGVGATAVTGVGGVGRPGATTTVTGVGEATAARGGRGRGGAAATTTTGAVSAGAAGGVGSTSVQSGSGTGAGSGRGGRASATGRPGATSVTGGVAGSATGVTSTEPVARGGVAGAVASPGRGGRGSGSGAGTGTVVGGGGAGGTDTTVRQRVETSPGRGGRASASGGAVGADRRTTLEALFAGRGSAMGQFQAEIWLVHQQPRGPEHVQQQSLRFSGSATDYSFPPVSISTSRGIVTLDITGRLSVVESNTSGTTVEVTIARRARAAGAPPLDTTGWSKSLYKVAGAEDVISFELPALQKATEDLLSGHKFSVRLRVTK